MMNYLKLVNDKLEVGAINDLVAAENCGAISLFIGTTRNNCDGKKVVRLEYEAYEPMAIKSLESICDEVRSKWNQVHNIAIYHRLGIVPVKEASIVIAISSPHRQDSLDAVSYCIDRVKATVPIWKKEIYDGNSTSSKQVDITNRPIEVNNMDKSLIQINVTSEELMKRIQNFIERKREQVNISNIHDFIPSKQVLDGNAEDDLDTCARVRTLFKKRSDSKGHLKVFRVNNAWGPQTRRQPPTPVKQEVKSNLPPGIEERVLNVEKYLSIQRVSSDIYQRLKDMEDRIMELQAMSPEYAQFWKYSTNRNTSSEEVMNIKSKCLYNADDIDKQIKLMESQTAMDH